MKVVAPIKIDIYEIPLRLTEAQASTLVKEVQKIRENAENADLRKASQALIDAIAEMI